MWSLFEKRWRDKHVMPFESRSRRQFLLTVLLISSVPFALFSENPFNVRYTVAPCTAALLMWLFFFPPSLPHLFNPRSVAVL